MYGVRVGWRSEEFWGYWNSGVFVSINIEVRKEVV